MFDVAAIGANLVKLRKAKGLTQSGFAEKLLVTRQAVSKWERGECMPDVSLLQEIAEVLDTTIENILGAKESKILNEGSNFELIENMLETQNYSYAQHLLVKMKQDSAKKAFFEARLLYHKQLYGEAKQALLRAKAGDSDGELTLQIYRLGKAIDNAAGGMIPYSRNFGWVRLIIMSGAVMTLLAAVVTMLILS